LGFAVGYVLPSALEVERFFAWMHHFRRLVTRWDYHIENVLDFVQLAFTSCSGVYDEGE